MGSALGASPSRGAREAQLAAELDAARAAQRTIVRLVEPLLGHGVLRTGKALLAAVGVPIGPPRTPERGLDADELGTVLGALDGLGIAGLGGGDAGC